ncbi:hypothetical protein B0J17DRAFT_686661 [Rhizoctonia solani]|nr:hypothetical protein B0J17DRAFT_686661 [Rhizoctonia solani]
MRCLERRRACSTVSDPKIGGGDAGHKTGGSVRKYATFSSKVHSSFGGGRERAAPGGVIWRA